MVKLSKIEAVRDYQVKKQPKPTPRPNSPKRLIKLLLRGQPHSHKGDSQVCMSCKDPVQFQSPWCWDYRHVSPSTALPILFFM